MGFNKRFFLVVMVIANSFLSACTTVKPWERGNLAKTQMAINPDPAQATMRNHIYGSREAASGSSSGAGGGGCGCY